jgi:hypothetical protein
MDRAQFRSVEVSDSMPRFQLSVPAVFSAADFRTATNTSKNREPNRLVFRLFHCASQASPYHLSYSAAREKARLTARSSKKATKL